MKVVPRDIVRRPPSLSLSNPKVPARMRLQPGGMRMQPGGITCTKAREWYVLDGTCSLGPDLDKSWPQSVEESMHADA